MGDTRTQTDLSKVYDLGACCYVTKPMNLDQVARIVHSLDNMWFTVVKREGRD